jgi:hypothetical protein
MKKIYSSVVLFIFLLISTYSKGMAQHTVITRDSFAIIEARALKNKLGLSDEQHKKVEAACRAHEIRKSNFNLQRTDTIIRRKGLHLIREKYTNSLKAILTNEQFIRYELLLQEREIRFRKLLEKPATDKNSDKTKF